MPAQTLPAHVFTLTADAGADPALATFGYGAGGGMTLGQSAANATFTIDGIAYSRATNSVDDVIPGMALTLKKAAPGQPVIICHEWAKNTPRAAALHVTLDGDTFTEVWRDPNLVAWSGAFCIGPTATGKVVGWLKNDARFPSGKTYMRGDLILD